MALGIVPGNPTRPDGASPFASRLAGVAVGQERYRHGCSQATGGCGVLSETGIRSEGRPQARGRIGRSGTAPDPPCPSPTAATRPIEMTAPDQTRLANWGNSTSGHLPWPEQRFRSECQTTPTPDVLVSRMLHNAATIRGIKRTAQPAAKRSRAARRRHPAFHRCPESGRSRSGRRWSPFGTVDRRSR